MIAPNGLMRIFWPTDIARSERPGVIVGWRNSELDMVVVTILFQVDVSLGDAVAAFAVSRLIDNRHATLTMLSEWATCSAAALIPLIASSTGVAACLCKFWVR